jgi:4-hydroxyphenylpyruvate dioxygenase-like putative hemolysin
VKWHQQTTKYSATRHIQKDVKRKKMGLWQQLYEQFFLAFVEQSITLKGPEIISSFQINL